MNLSSIYANWYRKEQEERDPQRLYISDIGKCPREVYYRINCHYKDPVTEQEEINFQIMLSEAEALEENLYLALLEAGIEAYYQGKVFVDDRENWGGRFDIIANYDGMRIIEVKSLHPNNFRYDIERPAHHYQAIAYHHYCEEPWQLTAPPILWYVDRGGMNTPQEIPVMEWGKEVEELMDELDHMRSMSPDHIPDRLPKQLFLRNARKAIVYEPDPRCRSPYCKYTMECEQDMSQSTWATRTHHKDYGYGPWDLKTKAITDYSVFGEFVDSIIDKDMR